VYETISVEDRKKPAVGLIYKDFANDARSAASSKGMPGVRLIPETIPSEWTNLPDIEVGISAVIDDIVAGLTKPLTSEEQSPKATDLEKPSRIVFKGDLAEANLFFYKRGWTDGLPILPPTEQAVAEMLTGTDLSPDHLVAVLGPRLGKATVEKIAVNAVMAGALPTYMPLLIAGVKALADPVIGPTGLAVSTLSFAPLWIVSGSIRQDLNINQGYGALNPGDIANAAIGRALGLITKNIRGVRKGMEDMGVLGNPARYSMVAGENEEDSPWEPLHVEHGLKKEDNAVTLAFSRSFVTLNPYGTDEKGLLSTLIYNIWPEGEGSLQIMLPPTLAKVLGSAGWTKKNVKDFIIENARVPWYRHPRYWSVSRELSPTASPLNPDDSVAVLKRTAGVPDPILIFVAGGSGSRIGLFGGSARDSVTKKVELPANWAKLVQKYKNVVPSYARY
jgi:hypothetical protein